MRGGSPKDAYSLHNNLLVSSASGVNANKRNSIGLNRQISCSSLSPQVQPFANLRMMSQVSKDAIRTEHASAEENKSVRSLRHLTSNASTYRYSINNNTETTSPRQHYGNIKLAYYAGSTGA